MTPNFNENSFRSDGESARQRPTTPKSPTSPGTAPDDAMDVSPTTSSAMGPPNGTTNKRAKSPDGSKKSSGALNQSGSAAQNTKVVQTAFVHKLYQMLEDQSIQHLITWSSTEDSFLISPSTDFSKVLSTYFKHTNVSSFVRQLNMYGFHKVSDVFHTGSPETPLWEFKHGNGHFKKGDPDSLRDIKRRASRHTLIHRDSFSTSQKQPPQHPPLPETTAESTESRLDLLERNLYDVHSRLTRSEEQNARMNTRYQDLTDKLTKSYQHNKELSQHLASLVEDPNHPVRRSISLMQNDIGHHLDAIRAAQATENHSSHHRPYLPRPGEAHMSSPASMAYDDRRRASIQVLPSQQQHHHRPIAPSPIRHGSIGTARSSPVSGRLAPPPPAFSSPATPPLPTQTSHIPAVAVEPPPYIPRRHTSADIQSSNSWPPPPPPLPNDTQEPQPSGPFASYASNYMTTPSGGDRQIQDKLASYSFGSSNKHSSSGSSNNRLPVAISNEPSRGSSPPPPFLVPPASENWPAPPPVRMPFRDVFKNSGVGSPGNSSAPTRRSSMANIHNMLNPADTAEQENEDEHTGDDPRKRKRLG